MDWFQEVFHHSRLRAASFNWLGIHFPADLEDIVDINYDLQLPRIKALIKQWKSITVVETIIIPKLNHFLISLQFLQKIDIFIEQRSF